jgi:hypothetical protein
MKATIHPRDHAESVVSLARPRSAIGREGDEAERCCGLGGADSGDKSALAGLSVNSESTGCEVKPRETVRAERLLSEGLDDECPKPRRRSGIVIL